MRDESLIRYLTAVNDQFNNSFVELFSEAKYEHALRLTQGVLARVITKHQQDVEFLAEIRSKLDKWQNLIQAALPNNHDKEELWRIVRDIDVSTVDANEEAAFRRTKLLLIDLLRRSFQDDRLQELAKNIIESENEILESSESLYSRITSKNLCDQSRTEADITSEQKSRLLDFIVSNSDESNDVFIKKINILTGGFSKQTILLELGDARFLPRKLVIRRDCADSPVGTSVSEEFPLLDLLFRSGVCVPKPFLMDRNEVFGSPLIIVAHSEGEVIGDGHKLNVSPDKYAKAALSLADNLARLHSIEIDEVPRSVPGRESSNEELMLNEISEFREIWKNADDICVVAETALSWMEKNIERCGGNKCLTHGDIRFHNILTKEDSIVSILDWELASLRHPALDLAYCYHHVSEMVDWKQFFQRYQDSGGQYIDPDTLTFYALRCELLTSSYLAKFETEFLKGGNQRIHLAYAGSHLKQQNIYFLSSRFKNILAGKHLC